VQQHQVDGLPLDFHVFLVDGFLAGKNTLGGGYVELDNRIRRRGDGLLNHAGHAEAPAEELFKKFVKGLMRH
jgi:hypothetical protein